MKFKLFSLFILLIFTACDISLDGNTFYVVEGKLLDTLNQPVQNHHLLVVTSHGDLLFPYERIELNNGNTNIDGYFKINFPASSASIYLKFEPDYFIYDSISDNGQYYGSKYEVFLDQKNNSNNHFNIGKVFIRKSLY